MPGSDSLRARRKRQRRRPPPLQAGGPTWEAMKRFTVPRLRQALIYSVVLHVVGCLAFVIGTPWKRMPAPLMREIPIHLVSFSPPPGRLLSAQPPAGRGGRVETKPHQPAKPKATEVRRNARPVPVQKTAKAKPDTVPSFSADRVASSDTSTTLRGTVAVAGGGEGALEIGVDGPISAYAYYLQVVRDKIARYWVPPAGLVSGGREMASVVNFRIDRRGKITTSYIEEPSGTSVFDQAGLRAVAQADPLPPLPQDYGGDWLGIHLRFVYKE